MKVINEEGEGAPAPSGTSSVDVAQAPGKIGPGLNTRKSVKKKKKKKNNFEKTLVKIKEL